MGVMRAMVVREVVMPCVMMVAMEGCTIGLTIMASTVMARGLSPFVFVVYTNAISSILLLPNLFKWHKDRREKPFFTLELLARLSLLGLTGVTIAQNLAFLGLSYSSPILACGMGNLIPTFSFLVSCIIPRTTKLDWRGSSTRVKLIGGFISILGALSVILYRGPVINKQYSYSSSSVLQIPPQLFIFSSTHENWVLGGVLLAAASLAFSIWNIIQVGMIKQYPYAMEIASAYTFIGTIQTTLVSMIMEWNNPSAWEVNLDMELLVIVSTAIFGSVIRSRVQIWCMKVKGPLYVPLFKPLGIPIAILCGCLFFSDKFHYGSIIGATIVGMGNYAVMWGQIREAEEKDHNTIDSSDNKVPLLKQNLQV